MKKLEHPRYDVYVIDNRVTDPGEPPIHEIEVVGLEREINKKKGDFIVIYPTGKRPWRQFFDRYHSALMHTVKPNHEAEVHPMFEDMTKEHFLPHTTGGGFTKRQALKRYDAHDSMMYGFAIAAAEGRVKVAFMDMEIDFDNNEDD